MSGSIVIEGLVKRFGDQTVLDGLDVAIEPGEMFILMGLSGTGKSVTLKHLLRLIEPDAGRILIDGEDLAQMTPARLGDYLCRTGTVFQYAALFDSMTAADNIAFPLREHTDRSEADIAATVEDLLRRVQLEGRGDRMPSELSGGMRKRVGIARSLALEPDILYFDEPTSGLDPVTAAVIEDLIMETHRDFGYTGLVITHHWELAQRLASRVALLWRGRIHAIGTPGEFEASHDPIIRGFLDRDPRVLNLPTGPDGQRA